MISRTFGAPLGAVIALGKSGLDSLALRPMTPPNCDSGTGRIIEPSAVVLCPRAEPDKPMQLPSRMATAAVSNQFLSRRIGASCCWPDQSLLRGLKAPLHLLDQLVDAEARRPLARRIVLERREEFAGNGLRRDERGRTVAHEPIVVGG